MYHGSTADTNLNRISIRLLLQTPSTANLAIAPRLTLAQYNPPTAMQRASGPPAMHTHTAGQLSTAHHSSPVSPMKVPAHAHLLWMC